MTALCALLPVVPASATPTLPAPVLPAASASTSASPTRVAVPPVAPPPTDGGISPAAPDPHPPLGGVAPDGSTPGGARLLSRGLILPRGAPPLPASLTAHAWVLVDLDSGAILAARDPHGRYQPASILKWLTAVTLIPQLAGDRRVMVDADTVRTPPTRAGLVAGGTYTVDQLFAGMLLVSGNDTAVARAKAAGGVQQTVDAMNRTALRLGAYDTFAQTPSGLDGWQQLTSPYDMAIILRAALAIPRLVQYARLPSATLPVQSVNGYGPVTLVNQNEQFLTNVPGAIAAKTGFTDAAQQTFVGAIQRHGRRLGVVFMRAERWPTAQWQQATDLMNWGFALPAHTAAVGSLAAPVSMPGPAAGVANAQLVDPAQRERHAAALASAVAAVTTLRIGRSTGGDGIRVGLILLGALLVLAGGTLHWHANRLH